MPKLPVEDIDVLVRSPHAREPSRIYEYIYNRIGKNNGRRTPQHGRARADALVRGGKLAAAQPRAGGRPQQMAAGATTAQLW